MPGLFYCELQVARPLVVVVSSYISVNDWAGPLRRLSRDSGLESLIFWILRTLLDGTTHTGHLIAWRVKNLMAQVSPLRVKFEY